MKTTKKSVLPPSIQPRSKLGQTKPTVEDEKLQVAAKDKGATKGQVVVGQSNFDEAGAAEKSARLKALGVVGGATKGGHSKGAEASLVGLEIADDKKPKTGRFKKTVLAVLTGLIIANSVAPAFGQDAIRDHTQPTTQTVMTLDADSLKSPETFSPWETRLGDFNIDVKNDNLSPTVEAKIDNAMDRFSNRLENALSHNGLDLARSAATGSELGFDIFNQTGEATPAQTKAVQRALTDLVGDLPVAAFSDGLAETLTSFFTSKGISGDKLQAATLSDFGDAGGDLAKQLVEDFRDDKPVAFYSLATVLAGGAGAAAYFEGSSVLENIGVKPEFSAKVFKGTKLKLGASWEEKLSNPSFRVGVENRINFQNSTLNLTSEAQAIFSGPDLGSVDLSGWRVSSTLHTDDNRSGIRVWASDNDTTDWGIAEGMQAGTNVWHRTDNFQFSGNATYNFDQDRFNAQISADYRPNENVSFGLFGRHDSAGETQIGIGGRIRF